MEKKDILQESISNTEAEKMEKFLLMICAVAFIIVMGTHYYQEYTKQQIRNTLETKNK